jgi:peroxiredoxin
MRRKNIGSVALALALVVPLGATAARPACAEGANLNGRVAPDIRLAAGTNGVTAGTTMSSLKGKVVLLEFWLRDCPICRRTLPEVQDLHARWSGLGLVALTVLHQFGPEDPVLQRYMSDSGFTFPVGTDRDGSLAAQYGVRSRPVQYVVGVDGRVKASNGAPAEVLQRELGMYRLARLGKVPDALKPVRENVWQYRLGQALREATAAAAAAGAGEEVKGVEARVRALAEDDVRGRGAWVRYLRSRNRGPEAAAAVQELTREYAGTALESAAQQAATGG